MMTWTPDQIEVMEDENMMAAIREAEERMDEKLFVPPMPVDGGETDEREE